MLCGGAPSSSIEASTAVEAEGLHAYFFLREVGKASSSMHVLYRRKNCLNLTVVMKRATLGRFSEPHPSVLGRSDDLLSK